MKAMGRVRSGPIKMCHETVVRAVTDGLRGKCEQKGKGDSEVLCSDYRENDAFD